MLNNLTMEQIFCIISIVVAIIYRIVAFNKIKKKNATKEGREYISSKGGRIILLLEARILLMIIIFILVSVLKIGLTSSVSVLVLAWASSILVESKARK